MKYTAKYVCQLFDINRETLRYYEKEGLITPEIDENNHYRYYDDWDINFLLEVIQYRKMGFSIEEIKQIFNEDDLDIYTNRIKNRSENLKKRIALEQMILKRNNEYMQSLEFIKPRLETYEIVYSQPQYMIPLRKNYDFIFSKESTDMFPIILNNFDFFDNTVYIPIDEFQTQSNSYYWTFTIYKEWADALQIKTEAMKYIPSQLCIRTIIDAKERWNFGYNLFDDALKYIESNHYEVCDSIFGHLLTRIHEDNKYCRYIEIYIPVKKKSS